MHILASLQTPTPTGFANVLLLLPIAATLWFRWVAHRAGEARARIIWAGFRKFGRFILTTVVAIWWVLWDLGANHPSSVESWHFWLPPTVGLGVFLFLGAQADRRVLRLKWTTVDSLRQAWWKLVSYVIPLLMITAAFELILGRKMHGLAWLPIAGVISKIGTGFLRGAEGLKFKTLKSGEYRNRALRVARGMDVTLERVLVVPAGKGHLTNAYGMSNAIALTDSLGQHLNDGQMDFVVAHEVAHVKLKHGRKHILLAVAIFTITALSYFVLPLQKTKFHPIFQLLGIFGPVMALYYSSRQFEYSADHKAIEFTDAPEVAVQALAKLYQSRELPAASDGLTELFMTHPTLTHRVRAIAKHAQISSDSLRLALEEAGMVLGDRRDVHLPANFTG